MTIELSVDTSKLDRRIDKIVGGMNRAVRNASKRTASKGTTIIRKAVQERALFTRKAVDRSLKTDRVGETGLRITLIKGKRISLKEFSPTQGKKGVSYRINPKGKRGFRRHAFIGKGKFNRHIFRRKGKPRGPVTQFFGVSVWGAFVGGNTFSNSLMQPVQKELQEFYRARLNHEIKYIIINSETGG